MQAALPIAQPLRFPSYSVAAVVLTGLMVMPTPANSFQPAKVAVSETRFDWLDGGGGIPPAELKQINGSGAAELASSVEDKVERLAQGTGSTPITRGGSVEIVEAVGDKLKSLSIEKTSEVGESETRARVIEHALSWRGVPYAWGGESRAGIDCSALVQQVFRSLGIELPRTSYEQFRMGVGLPLNQLLPGDLVFFSTNGPGASHVGIYLGEKKFISATRSKVEIQSLENPYWQKAYRGGRRIL